MLTSSEMRSWEKTWHADAAFMWVVLISVDSKLEMSTVFCTSHDTGKKWPHGVSETKLRTKQYFRTNQVRTNQEQVFLRYKTDAHVM